ncbi:MAG TPA: hypothetical protein PKD99_02405 [Sphingopyxis sp.]|nr:hypothetical protein [Sphingopyxis sp.]HMP43929.1 hypothetical protein [Sphingopyxis sp.]HMQ18096.1 hypothetical protein [Sphingopyxis sp.]
MSELILAIGDENVEFQNLDHCMDGFRMNHGKTLISFGTGQSVNLDGTTKLGIILWLDRDAVKAAVAR